MKRKIPVPVDIKTPKVDTDIPIPRSNHRNFPWDKMGVGDSFFIECEDKDDVRVSQVTALASGKRAGLRVITRREFQDGKLGIRAWRVG